MQYQKMLHRVMAGLLCVSMQGLATAIDNVGTVLDDSVTVSTSSFLQTGKTLNDLAYWKCQVSAISEGSHINMRLAESGEALIQGQTGTWFQTGDNQIEIQLPRSSYLLDNISGSTGVEQSDNFSATDTFGNFLDCDWNGDQRNVQRTFFDDGHEDDIQKLISGPGFNGAQGATDFTWNCAPIASGSNPSFNTMTLSNDNTAVIDGFLATWYTSPDGDLFLFNESEFYALTNIDFSLSGLNEIGLNINSQRSTCVI